MQHEGRSNQQTKFARTLVRNGLTIVRTLVRNASLITLVALLRTLQSRTSVRNGLAILSTRVASLRTLPRFAFVSVHQLCPAVSNGSWFSSNRPSERIPDDRQRRFKIGPHRYEGGRIRA